MAKGIDGIGLTALALGGVLVYAGIKGYSLLTVVENVIVGRPIHTDVKIVNRLTVDVPTTEAIISGASAGIPATSTGRNKGPS